ncbi:hypothetical protein CASFOL_034401 [Castilleja foliolosa]|uniref:Uncharacterized protein n=1 Tax=Castilleja foliolosa TaxID=1961234 RepID=A0ABD3BW57_9LAMI
MTADLEWFSTVFGWWCDDSASSDRDGAPLIGGKRRAFSRPMMEILERLEAFGEFEGQLNSRRTFERDWSFESLALMDNSGRGKAICLSGYHRNCSISEGYHSSTRRRVYMAWA